MNDSERLLLSHLSRHGPTSRSDLTAATGLSKAAVSTLSRALLDGDLVHEVATHRNPSRQGRPSVLLDLNPGYGYLIGARVDEDPLVMVLTDLKGAVLARHRAPLAATPDAVAAALADGVEALGEEAGVPRRRLLGLGVAVSGIVDSDRGVCRHSAILDWHDVPLADLARAATGLPTSLENDANAVAVAEGLYGEARGHDDFAVVTLGRGVGGAQFVGGRLYRGHDGGAGELAHCTIVLDGAPCLCGKRGCLDTVASSGAILADARRRGLEVASPEELEERALRGDGEATAALRHAARLLGLAVSHLINITDPGLVLIAGNTRPGTVFATATRQAIEEHLLPRRLATLDLTFRPLDPEAWARGAASLAASAILSGRVPLPA